MATRMACIALLLLGCVHPPNQQPRPASSSPASSAGPATPATLATPAPKDAPAVKSADFTRDVRPILESRCQPCHFAGGKMYERLPFDRPETIRKLGVKLFTRIKDEPSQATIREFLAQSSK